MPSLLCCVIVRRRRIVTVHCLLTSIAVARQRQFLRYNITDQSLTDPLNVVPLAVVIPGQILQDDRTRPTQSNERSNHVDAERIQRQMVLLATIIGQGRISDAGPVVAGPGGEVYHGNASPVCAKDLLDPPVVGDVGGIKRHRHAGPDDFPWPEHTVFAAEGLYGNGNIGIAAHLSEAASDHWLPAGTTTLRPVGMYGNGRCAKPLRNINRLAPPSQELGFGDLLSQQKSLPTKGLWLPFGLPARGRSSV